MPLPAIPSVSKFFEKVPEAASAENLYLIDKSVIKQGGDFMGKTVCPSDIIAEENIDTVIISFTSQITREITDEIGACYPSVKNIIFLGELFNEDFSLETAVLDI